MIETLKKIKWTIFLDHFIFFLIQNTQKEKEMKKLFFLATTLVFLSACGEDLPETNENATSNEDFDIDESDTQTLYIGLTNAPDGFTPLNAPSTAAGFAQRFLFDSLLVMPEVDEFDSALASEFSTEDNQTYTIELDTDAYWSDGHPVTSDDVAFTLNAIANPDVETSRGLALSLLEGTDSSGKLTEGLEELPSVTIIDDKTLEFRTEQPLDPATVQEHIGFNVLIAPSHIFSDIEPSELSTAQETTQPEVFSGPYKLEYYDDNNYAHLASNEEYYRGTPELTDIYLRVLSASSMVTEFQSGGIHMAAGAGIGMVPVQDIPILEEDDSIVVEESLGINAQYLILNNERFEDERIRRAFDHAMNTQLAVDELMQGRAEVLASPYTSDHPYHDPDLEPLDYDPDLARELLEEADFNFDQEIDFIVPTGNQVREQHGDLIQQELEAIGLNVNQINVDFPTSLEMARELDYDLSLRGNMKNVDPDISHLYRSGSPNNHFALEDAHIDELLDRGMEETSFETRYPIYQELQGYLQEQSPIIPMYTDVMFMVRNERLNGGINEHWAGSLHDVHEWTLDAP